MDAYEVWFEGFDVDDQVTDLDEYINGFDTEEEALEFARSIESADDYLEPDYIDDMIGVDGRIEVWVEKVCEEYEEDGDCIVLEAFDIPVHR